MDQIHLERIHPHEQVRQLDVVAHSHLPIRHDMTRAAGEVVEDDLAVDRHQISRSIDDQVAIE